MYKHSTQKNHRDILEKHLLPQFGDKAITEITRQEVQAYVAHLVSNGYAPKTKDHIHDVLSAVLRTAVKWGQLRDNPARDVDLPALTNVRPKWVLTIPQATALLEAAAGADDGGSAAALGTSARRAVCTSLEGFDEQSQCLMVREAVYEGAFSTPKTTAGLRQIPQTQR